MQGIYCSYTDAATIRSLLSLLSKRPNEKSTRLCQFSASEFIEQYIADPIGMYVEVYVNCYDTLHGIMYTICHHSIFLPESSGSVSFLVQNDFGGC